MNANKLLIFTLLLGLYSSPIFSQVSAREILENTNSTIDLGFLNQPAKKVGKYSPTDRIFKLAKSKMNANDLKGFELWYYSNFYANPEKLLQDNLKKSLTKVKHYDRYDKKGQRPLRAYLAAREYSQSIPQNMTIDHLRNIQAKLLSKKSIDIPALKIFIQDKTLKSNSEGAGDHYIGQVRSNFWGWREKNGKIPQYYYRRIPNRKVINRKNEVKTYAQLKSKGLNPWINYNPRKKMVYYYNARDNFDLNICKARVSENICNSINLETAEKGQFLVKNNPKNQELHRHWIIGNVNWAIKELDKSLKQAKTNHNIIEAVAIFYYRLIGIHPFKNGNGRTSRVIAEKILNQHGLPSPIIYPFGIDMTISEKDFVTLFADGVAVSRYFHRDLEILLNAGVPYYYTSSQFLGPGWFPRSALNKVSPKEFMAWVMQYQSKSAKSRRNYGPYLAIKEFLRWKRSTDQKTLNYMYTITKLPKEFR